MFCENEEKGSADCFVLLYIENYLFEFGIILFIYRIGWEEDIKLNENVFC